jgi:hypothetical protein
MKYITVSRYKLTFNNILILLLSRVLDSIMSVSIRHAVGRCHQPTVAFEKCVSGRPPRPVTRVRRYQLQPATPHEPDAPLLARVVPPATTREGVAGRAGVVFPRGCCAGSRLPRLAGKAGRLGFDPFLGRVLPRPAQRPASGPGGPPPDPAGRSHCLN